MDATKRLISAAIALALVAGCQTSEGNVEITSARIAPVARTNAVHAIAQTHCTHVYECNELGGAHRFGDYDACAVSVRRETLARPDCNHDIDPARLSRCLDTIRTSSCGLPRSARFDPVCSDDELCR